LSQCTQVYTVVHDLPNVAALGITGSSFVGPLYLIMSINFESVLLVVRDKNVCAQ